MCRSIAQTWAKELYPSKWLSTLHAPTTSLISQEEELQALELHPAEADASEPPSQQELERWKVSLMKYHRAAGHPSN